MKKYIASPLLALFIIISWYLTYKYTGFSLIIIVGAGLIITYSIASYWIQNKKCFINCYFKETSLLSRILSSKVLLILIAFCIALVVTLFLFTSITTWSIDIWVIMIMDIVVLTILYKTITKTFRSTLKGDIGPHLVKSWSVGINTFVLTLFMLLYNYNTLKEPSYIKSTLKDTVQEAAKSYSSDSEFINTFVKLNIEKDAIVWYSTLYTNEKIDNEDARWLLWIFFLINGGIVYYGFSRFFIEFIAFDLEKSTKNNDENRN